MLPFYDGNAAMNTRKDNAPRKTGCTAYNALRLSALLNLVIFLTPDNSPEEHTLRGRLWTASLVLSLMFMVLLREENRDRAGYRQLRLFPSEQTELSQQGSLKVKSVVRKI